MGKLKHIEQDGITGTPESWTTTIINCYSSGKIFGTYAGGIVGRHGWNKTAAEAKNCYYLLSDTVSNSSGDSKQTMNAIGIEKLTTTEIDVLNSYIENDPDGVVTTDWKRWELDKNGNPSFVE